MTITGGKKSYVQHSFMEPIQVCKVRNKQLTETLRPDHRQIRFDLETLVA